MRVVSALDYPFIGAATIPPSRGHPLFASIRARRVFVASRTTFRRRFTLDRRCFSSWSLAHSRTSSSITGVRPQSSAN